MNPGDHRPEPSQAGDAHPTSHRPRRREGGFQDEGARRSLRRKLGGDRTAKRVTEIDKSIRFDAGAPRGRWRAPLARRAPYRYSWEARQVRRILGILG